MDNRARRTHNNEVWKRNALVPDKVPSINSLAMTRIDLSENHENQSPKHDGINEDTTYLALIYGTWYLGTCSKQWYGWSFSNWGTSGIALNGIQILYATNLVVPEMTFEPSIRDSSEDEDEEVYGS